MGCGFYKAPLLVFRPVASGHQYLPIFCGVLKHKARCRNLVSMGELSEGPFDFFKVTDRN